MKLSPPASSSDLEAAREIARRLHQHRRRGDRPSPDEHEKAVPPAYRRTPTPPPPAREAPEPPRWDAPAARLAPAESAALDPLAGFGEPAALDDVPALGVEEPAVSPEEMVGVAEPSLGGIPEPEALEASPPSPFDMVPDETGEEMVDAAAPPSWDDITETCLDLAQARGAMLVDPAGHVFSARGDWPAPGPAAIASKLVATMERTLKDAPTRAISAPLMGSHLTAWRVPLPEGLVTAAFIGDAPVRAEVRPTIDSAIHRGAGA